MGPGVRDTMGLLRLSRGTYRDSVRWICLLTSPKILETLPVASALTRGTLD